MIGSLVLVTPYGYGIPVNNGAYYAVRDVEAAKDEETVGWAIKRGVPLGTAAVTATASRTASRRAGPRASLILTWRTSRPDDPNSTAK